MPHKLALHGGPPVLAPGHGVYRWPIVTKSMERAVVAQLHDSLSIRDRSGVFGAFEDAFRAYHSRKYAVLSNSGTSAILSMFEGISLAPGDEVIASVFSFHASASPALYLGGRVLFADVDQDGGMSAQSVETLLSGRTRAVIVTHLWGLPTRDMAAISSLCTKAGVALFEDCSHAHGAKVDGKPVGAFGTAAAWSLQGQKIVSGGEGGVMLTNSVELFERAILQGHYNRRTRDEISTDGGTWRYHETGMGLKLRAHPLGVAVALHELAHLDEFIQQKAEFASHLRDTVAQYPFLRTPEVPRGVVPSWYAFPIYFDGTSTGGVTRARFVEALHAEGLCEVDIPGATCLLADLPLFIDPSMILGRRFGKTVQECNSADFLGGRTYARRIIKLPVWARREDRRVIDGYVAGFRKVCDYVAAGAPL